MKQNTYDTMATGKTHLTRDQQGEDNIQLRKREKKNNSKTTYAVISLMLQDKL